MLPDEKIGCHRLPRKCRVGVVKHHCQLWIALKGTDAEGKTVDTYGCADSFIPRLLIENAQMSRQTGAAVESFRNEVVKANDTAFQERRELLIRFAATGAPPRLVTGRE